MECPKCNSDNTRVLETRQQGPQRYRRHLCNACGHRYKTYQGYINVAAELKRIQQLQAEIDSFLKRLQA